MSEECDLPDIAGGQNQKWPVNFNCGPLTMTTLESEWCPGTTYMYIDRLLLIYSTFKHDSYT